MIEIIIPESDHRYTKLDGHLPDRTIFYFPAVTEMGACKRKMGTNTKTEFHICQHLTCTFTMHTSY